MRCRTARIWMTQHLREALPPEHDAALTRHLSGCPACRAEQEALRHLSARLLERRPAATPTHRPVLPVGWTQRHLQAHPHPGAAPVPSRRTAPGLALAASLLVTLAALRWDHRRPAAQIAPDSTRLANLGSNELPRQALTPSPSPNPGKGETRPGGAFRFPLAQNWERGRVPAERVVGEGLPAQQLTSSRTSGEGDLDHLNGDPVQDTRRWVSLSPADWQRLEDRVRRHVRVQDDFVQIPFPRLAAASDRPLVAATEAYKQEAAIVDTRLAREVTLQQKGTALSDLCARLTRETGIRLTAGSSVADEKVTVFCQKQPLRDVMRQLSRPFGYTWLRSGSRNPTPSPSPGGRGVTVGTDGVSYAP
jgi:hypothetical protein